MRARRLQRVPVRGDTPAPRGERSRGLAPLAPLALLAMLPASPAAPASAAGAGAGLASAGGQQAAASSAAYAATRERSARRAHVRVADLRQVLEEASRPGAARTFDEALRSRFFDSYRQVLRAERVLALEAYRPDADPPSPAYFEAARAYAQFVALLKPLHGAVVARREARELLVAALAAADGLEAQLTGLDPVAGRTSPAHGPARTSGDGAGS